MSDIRANARGRLREGARRRPGAGVAALRGGFTLVELLVVLAIVGLLFIWLVVALVGGYQRSKIVNTEAFIATLKSGCVAYRENYGAGRDYPPMDPVGTCTVNTATDTSSRNLVKYLCSPLRIYKGFANVTSAQAMPGLGNVSGEVQKPLLSVEESRMFNGCLIDYWERRILYYSGTPGGGDPFAGIRAHDQANPGNSAHCDIVSDGPFPGGKDPDGKDCRISTFRTKLEVD